MFELTEARLTDLTKQVGDARVGLGLDEEVAVKEGYVELGGQGAPKCGLACTHKPGEYDLWPGARVESVDHDP